MSHTWAHLVLDVVRGVVQHIVECLHGPVERVDELEGRGQDVVSDHVVVGDPVVLPLPVQSGKQGQTSNLGQTSRTIPPPTHTRKLF